MSKEIRIASEGKYRIFFFIVYVEAKILPSNEDFGEHASFEAMEPELFLFRQHR